jgi:phage head maturation protease
VAVRNGELIGTAIFAPKEIDEFAWSIGEKIKAGFISAGSVGFKSKRVEILDKSKDGTRLIHREQDLYEYSIVNIPSLASSGVRKDVDNVQVKAHNEFDKDFWTSAKPADDLSLVFGRGLLKQIWEE